jgi:hypothetical protein
LLIGATILELANAWIPGLPALIIVLGWLALVKGAFILFFPGTAASLYAKFSKKGMFVSCGVVAFILGIVLLYW